MTVIDHDGKKYLALSVHSTAFDGSDGFDVCVIELTPAVLADWQAKCEAADRLAKDIGVLYLGFDDCSPEWRAAYLEEDTIDADGEICPPVWEGDPQRTEVDRLEVSTSVLEWTAMPKHTDDHVNAIVWRSELPTIAAALNSVPHEEAELHAQVEARVADASEHYHELVKDPVRVPPVMKGGEE